MTLTEILAQSLASTPPVSEPWWAGKGMFFVWRAVCVWGLAQNNDGTFKKALGKKSLGEMFPGEMCHLSH